MFRQLDEACWHAAHSGHRGAVDLLVQAGAATDVPFGSRSLTADELLEGVSHHAIPSSAFLSMPDGTVGAVRKMWLARDAGLGIGLFSLVFFFLLFCFVFFFGWLVAITGLVFIFGRSARHRDQR